MESVEEKDPATTLVYLDPNTVEFTANSTTYFVNRDIERLTIARYEQYEKFNISLGFSIDFPTLSAALKNAGTLIFSGDAEGAYIEIQNIIRGVAMVSEKRSSIALSMCTLFINRAGEDLNEWSPEMAEEKIIDWEREGIAVGFFLGLALSMVEGYRTVFNSILAEYSALSELSQKLLTDPDSL